MRLTAEDAGAYDEDGGGCGAHGWMDGIGGRGGMTTLRGVDVGEHIYDKEKCDFVVTYAIKVAGR